MFKGRGGKKDEKEGKEKLCKEAPHISS